MYIKYCDGNEDIKMFFEEFKNCNHLDIRQRNVDLYKNDDGHIVYVHSETSSTKIISIDCHINMTDEIYNLLLSLKFNFNVSYSKLEKRDDNDVTYLHNFIISDCNDYVDGFINYSKKEDFDKVYDIMLKYKIVFSYKDFIANNNFKHLYNKTWSKCILKDDNIFYSSPSGKFIKTEHDDIRINILESDFEKNKDILRQVLRHAL